MAISFYVHEDWARAVLVDCAEEQEGPCSDRIGFPRMTLVSRSRRTTAQCALSDGLSREPDENCAPRSRLSSECHLSSVDGIADCGLRRRSDLCKLGLGVM